MRAAAFIAFIAAARIAFVGTIACLVAVRTAFMAFIGAGAAAFRMAFVATNACSLASLLTAFIAFMAAARIAFVGTIACSLAALLTAFIAFIAALLSLLAHDLHRLHG